MRFDQSWRQRRPRRLDHFRAGRDCDFAQRSHGLDLFSARQDCPAFVELRRFAVEDARGLEQIDTVFLSVGGRAALSYQAEDRTAREQSKRANDRKNPGSIFHLHCQLSIRSCCAFHLIRRSCFSARLPRCEARAASTARRILAVGVLRLFTQSRKLRTCGTVPSPLDSISISGFICFSLPINSPPSG